MSVRWRRGLDPAKRSCSSRNGTRPIRVAQICGATDGASWMVQIAAGLRDRGYDVVAVIGGGGGETAAGLRAEGIPYYVQPHALFTYGPALRTLSVLTMGRGARALSGLSLLGEAIRMARLLRRLRVDVVHTHVITSILVGRIAAFLARVPIRVAMVAGPYQLEAPAFRRLDLGTLWMDHRVLCGCAHTNQLYAGLGVPARRRTQVSYGVEPSEFDPDRTDRARFREELGLDLDVPLIGQVAYFYAPSSGIFASPLADGRGLKGQDDFVQAAALVLARRPEARFVLVGDGWGEAGERHYLEVQRRARELGLDGALTFAGRRRDVATVLAALDVSVQCSLSENYGGTLESLLMCAPTIATAVGGMPEVVRHEQTGLLVPPRDPEALAAAMLRLIEDRQFARRLGRAGRDVILGGYTIGHTIGGVDRVYRELARERRIVI